jgi:aspartate kinase
VIKVFKFGGASVRDAEGIKNLVKILKMNSDDQILIVVSAMGKMTNSLESLNHAYVNQQDNVHQVFDEIKQYHENILNELFDSSAHPVFDEVANTFIEIEWMLEDEPHPDYNFNYDQIVSIGELVSSRIVSAYLNQCEIKSKWIDARGYIHTDNTYREGKIDWDKTCNSIAKLATDLDTQSIVTQGFIGGTSENFSTTLGREGSDYTGAVFASCLKADSLTIWKDVPGVLNSDPKIFNNSRKYDELPYSEALEMAYYGATVIHPKTIKPLQNSGIPLFVKPFLSPEESGTKIHETAALNTDITAIILKKNQVLLSISTTDLSFIDEMILSRVFKAMDDVNIKVNMMQVSALSLSLCFDYDETKFGKLSSELGQFKIRFNTGLELWTLRHHKPADLENYTSGKTILMEQISRSTAQFVLK